MVRHVAWMYLVMAATAAGLTPQLQNDQELVRLFTEDQARVPREALGHRGHHA
jgi:hypothetical protein